MKQHITPKQLNELSEKGYKKLVDWAEDRNRVKGEVGTVYPLLSIGQMIEFLDGKFINFWRGQRKDWLIVIDDNHEVIVKKELCDCLWEAVKEILNQTKRG